ncbi:hypothetical protein PUN28_002669 [Cardiocondyla obscurior]|uniref:Uncharacterized protein n=1 Tax=Cardiocondyla obscurior TaxID=286306 RepID=A0AAW2GVE3_9HYME
MQEGKKRGTQEAVKIVTEYHFSVHTGSRKKLRYNTILLNYKKSPVRNCLQSSKDEIIGERILFTWTRIRNLSYAVETLVNVAKEKKKEKKEEKRGARHQRLFSSSSKDNFNCIQRESSSNPCFYFIPEQSRR